MALGKYNIKATVREQKIHRLDDELKLIDLYKGEANPGPGNEAEAFFEAWVNGRHGHKVIKNGWPDFLLMHKDTGRPFAVEVKTAADRMSRRQEKCFAALESGGIAVYVWCPSEPKKLEPWRAYLKRTGRYRMEPDKASRKGNGNTEAVNTLNGSKSKSASLPIPK
jgi:hypothetical protein